jgi:hypothetical protein
MPNHKQSTVKADILQYTQKLALILHHRVTTTMGRGGCGELIEGNIPAKIWRFTRFMIENMLMNRLNIYSFYSKYHINQILCDGAGIL